MFNGMRIVKPRSKVSHKSIRQDAFMHLKSIKFKHSQKTQAGNCMAMKRVTSEAMKNNVIIQP